MVSRSRRGRLPAAERASRREQIVRAARDELLERGYEALTMQGVARRAGASKETLYAWFGSREDMITALVAEAGADTLVEVESALAAAPVDDVRSATATLESFGTRLLGLLTGPWSVAVNRAAMRSPALADVVLHQGRHAVGPLVEAYLRRLHRARVLRAPRAGQSFTLLYGLVVRDTQIRVLLGEPPPSSAALRRQVRDGVAAFVHVHDPE